MRQSVCVDVCMRVCFLFFLNTVYVACVLHAATSAKRLEPERNCREGSAVLGLDPLGNLKKLLPLKPIENGRDLACRGWGLRWVGLNGGRTVRGVRIDRRRQCPCQQARTRTVKTIALCA